MEIDRIGSLQPAKTEAETREEYDQLFAQFSGIDATSQPVTGQIKQIAFDNIIGTSASTLLATPIKAPTLSQREADLLDMFGMKVISEAKGFLIDPAHTACPVCLQPISREYRDDTIQRIEGILNKEVEDFRGRLRNLLLTESPMGFYQAYSVLDANIYQQVVTQIQCVNAAILAHNMAIRAKIDDPFGVMIYDKAIGLSGAYKTLNEALARLEESRESYRADIVGVHQVLLWNGNRFIRCARYGFAGLENAYSDKDWTIYDGISCGVPYLIDTYGNGNAHNRLFVVEEMYDNLDTAKWDMQREDNFDYEQISRELFSGC